MNLKPCICALLAVMAPTSFASAESGFYYGIGLTASSAESFPIFGAPSGTESSGTIGSIALTVGDRFESGGMFYGAEATADISVSGNLDFDGIACEDGFAAGPYFCDSTAVFRMRGFLGTDLMSSGYEVFGTLGYVAMFGEGAIDSSGSTDSGSVGGLTFGIGVQRQVASGAIFRAEIIRDDLDNILSMPAGTFSPTWEATSFSFSYIMGF